MERVLFLCFTSHRSHRSKTRPSEASADGVELSPRRRAADQTRSICNSRTRWNAASSADRSTQNRRSVCEQQAADVSSGEREEGSTDKDCVCISSHIYSAFNRTAEKFEKLSLTFEKIHKLQSKQFAKKRIFTGILVGRLLSGIVTHCGHFLRFTVSK